MCTCAITLRFIRRSLALLVSSSSSSVAIVGLLESQHMLSVYMGTTILILVYLSLYSVQDSATYNDDDDDYHLHLTIIKAKLLLVDHRHQSMIECGHDNATIEIKISVYCKLIKLI